MGRSAVVLKLERRLEQLETRPRRPGTAVPTGIAPLDALLPEGGLPRGRIVEWAGPSSSGKTGLLRIVLRRLRDEGESIALIDLDRTLFAPDWSALVGGEGLFWVVRPRTVGEAAWCAEMLLRSGAFGAVAFRAEGRGARPGGREGEEAPLRRSALVRLQRLAGEANAVFVAVGAAPLAALRLSFRPGRIEPVRGVSFGPFLPSLRPVWVRVERGRAVEVPLLCPVPERSVDPDSRDRKGPS